MNEDDPVITLENIHYYEKQRTNHFILIQQLNILLSSTNIININNITLESIVVKDDEQHVIMIVFDSIVNLMRNLISICNDSKKLNILKKDGSDENLRFRNIIKLVNIIF